MFSPLAAVIPLAFASGLNLYATIAVLGLCSRYGLVGLPDQFRGFEHPLVIGVALAMYLIEFVVDKIPWLDSIWDAVHTVIRPLGGAFVAVAAVGQATPAMRVLAALLGGSVAMTTHVTKASARAAVNTSPEPFSNWMLSLGEDLLALGLSVGALTHPALALAVAAGLIAVIVWFASALARFAGRRLSRRSTAAPPARVPENS
jgi:hypothetical protein